jgi:hypothetical protein
LGVNDNGLVRDMVDSGYKMKLAKNDKLNQLTLDLADSISENSNPPKLSILHSVYSPIHIYNPLFPFINYSDENFSDLFNLSTPPTVSTAVELCLMHRKLLIESQASLLFGKKRLDDSCDTSSNCSAMHYECLTKGFNPYPDLSKTSLKLGLPTQIDELAPQNLAYSPVYISQHFCMTHSSAHNITSLILSIVLSFTVTLSPFIPTHLALLYHLIAVLPHHLEKRGSSVEEKMKSAGEAQKTTTTKKKDDPKLKTGKNELDEVDFIESPFQDEVEIETFTEYSLLLAAKACYFIFSNPQILISVYSLTHIVKNEDALTVSSTSSSPLKSPVNLNTSCKTTTYSPTTIFEELLTIPILIINHPLVVSRSASLLKQVSLDPDHASAITSGGSDILPFSYLTSFLSPVIFSPRFLSEVLSDSFFHNFVSSLLTTFPGSSNFQMEFTQILECGKEVDFENKCVNNLENLSVLSSGNVDNSIKNTVEVSFSYFNSVRFDQDVTTLLLSKNSQKDQTDVLLGMLERLMFCLFNYLFIIFFFLKA